jgi:hypothetical protein
MDLRERRRAQREETQAQASLPPPPSPRPKPYGDHQRYAAPTREEFEAWCESAVTRWVATAWAATADQERDLAMTALWATGEMDPIKLAASRASAKAYLTLLHCTYEDYDGALCET